MPRRGLKLKQASAVLQIEPKELQNLVQFGVVKPRRSEGRTSCLAKRVFCSARPELLPFLTPL